MTKHMIVYPVTYVEIFNRNTDDEVLSGRIKGFSSLTEAKEFQKEKEHKEHEELNAEILDPIEFPISEAGILAAFEKGHEVERLGYVKK